MTPVLPSGACGAVRGGEEMSIPTQRVSCVPSCWDTAEEVGVGAGVWESGGASWKKLSPQTAR